MYSRRSTRTARSTTTGRTTRGGVRKTRGRRSGAGGGPEDRLKAAAESGPVRKWVQVKRQPAPSVKFLVEKWVLLDDLTEEERKKYNDEKREKELPSQSAEQLVSSEQNVATSDPTPMLAEESVAITTDAVTQEKTGAPTAAATTTTEMESTNVTTLQQEELLTTFSNSAHEAGSTNAHDKQQPSLDMPEKDDIVCLKTSQIDSDAREQEKMQGNVTNVPANYGNIETNETVGEQVAHLDQADGDNRGRNEDDFQPDAKRQRLE